MTRAGAIGRDDRTGEGRAVVASRAAPADRAPHDRPPVTHGFAALMFCTGGRTRVEQSGAWHLAPGDVLLVPAGQPHRVLEMQRSEYWGLALSAPSFAADGGAALLEPFERVRNGASAVVRVPSERHAFLESLFRELHDNGAAATGAVERSLLTLILAEVDRGAGTKALREVSGSGVVARSLRFIERNCLRRLTVEDVAAAVGRSATYVTTALTRATGRSAGDWILSGRMAEARRLLLHSDEMIDVVAERVGYADATHFIRMFRREHGKTPAAWRAEKASARVRPAGRAAGSSPNTAGDDGANASSRRTP